VTIRYVTKAERVDGEDGDVSYTAGTVFERDDAPRDTGLLDANGNRLYRLEQRAPIGFIQPKG
jgi:hypothetical protein